eukprot:Gb_22144 [translate_table: standard]
MPRRSFCAPILEAYAMIEKPRNSGEVCICGLNITKGCRNNPEANKTAFKFGWFHTRDLGYLDNDEHLFLIGHIKELINHGGEKISPMEVDVVLLSHHNIAQAVVFVVPDEKYGEEGGFCQNHDKAFESFLKGIAHGLTTAMVDVNLFSWKMGRKEEGIDFYREVIQLNDLVGQCNLGLSFLQGILSG